MTAKPMQAMGISFASFRRMEWADVIGVALVDPEKGALEPRACFILMFADGVVDYVPVIETALEWRARP